MLMVSSVWALTVIVFMAAGIPLAFMMNRVMREQRNKENF